MNSIADLCRTHRRNSYFDNGEGLTGVANHRNVILWYRWTAAGYSLVGETQTPQGAQRRLVEQEQQHSEACGKDGAR